MYSSWLIMETFSPFSPFQRGEYRSDLRKRSGTERRDRQSARDPLVPGSGGGSVPAAGERLPTAPPGRRPGPSSEAALLYPPQVSVPVRGEGPRKSLRGKPLIRDRVASVAPNGAIPAEASLSGPPG